MKKSEYKGPEFKVVKSTDQDIITTSGVTQPAWGGPIVDQPEFAEINL